MKKNIIKTLSYLLVFVLMFNFVMSTSAYAIVQEVPQDYDDSNDLIENQVPEAIKEAKDQDELQKELDELTYEITSLREENIKHFRLPDGTYQAVVYGEPVHRLNSDGEWVEIDNTLTDINGAIATGDGRVEFAKKITGNESLYTLHDGKYKVSVGLIGAEKKVEGVITNNEISEEGMTQLQKLKNIDNISSTIVYNDILKGIDLEYIVISNSIKENIIVKEVADNYKYTFTLELNGLTAKLDNGSIVLCDSSSEEPIYSIPAPYMYDASGNESLDVHYDLINLKNGKYEFVLTADSQWINSPERSFPVTIDPALVDIGQTEDTYVTSSYVPGNYGGVHGLFVSSTAETYYKFATPNLPSNMSISAVALDLPYYFDATNGTSATVGLYQITSSWDEDDVTWNTKPSINSTSISTKTLYVADGATVSNPLDARFYVTNYVRSWYSGTANHGFALKFISGTTSSVKFVAKEKMQTFAQLIISYTDYHLGQGVYSIQRNGSNYYFKSYAPATNALAWVLQDTTSYTSPPVSTSHLENIFKISYRPDSDDYVIRSMLDSSLVIYPSVHNNAPIAGRRSESDSQFSTKFTWKIECVYSGCYYITYTENGVKYYVRSNTTANSQKLVFTTNPDDSGTIWVFNTYTGNVYEDVEAQDFKYSLTVGEEYQYLAYMTSTRIGHNGPVNYRVKTMNYAETSLATINSATGELSAKGVGQIKVGVSYPGAPWVWYWIITIRTAGCKPYYEIDAGSSDSYSMNCQGYAFWTHDNPQEWYTTLQWYDILYDSFGSDDVMYGCVNNVPGFKTLLEENWLNTVFPGKWEEVYSSDGGWDVELDDNQWLVAFRTGKNEDLGRVDYHFWYRTDTGEWANKHGYTGTPSELLGDDLPTDNTSSGWSAGTAYPCFYDSDIIYYVITE